MSKLRLKETALEREERLAKERRAARKKAKRGPDLHFDYANETSERHWRLSEPTIYRTPEDLGTAYGTRGPSTSSGPGGRAGVKDYEQIQRELEEANFHAKLFDAMEDDERLDSMEARFNAYRVPERWASTGTKTQADNPNYMNEDEYAEWIRRGMWERRHKQEVEEQQRREREREERKAQEKKQRRNQARLEEENRRERRERKTRMASETFEQYLSSWTALTSNSSSQRVIAFKDIPWPMNPRPHSASDVTGEAISSFLLSESHSTNRPRKQRIRDALLIYHPDRFDKWVSMVADDTEKAKAREVAGEIVRILNSLAEQ
jgi:hypothetical protein